MERLKIHNTIIIIRVMEMKVPGGSFYRRKQDYFMRTQYMVFNLWLYERTFNANNFTRDTRQDAIISWNTGLLSNKSFSITMMGERSS